MSRIAYPWPFTVCSWALDDKLHDRLRLTFAIALSLLPRWVKHDFWRPTQPQNDRAKAETVKALIAAVDDDFELTQKTNKQYRGWGRSQQEALN